MDDGEMHMMPPPAPPPAGMSHMGGGMMHMTFFWGIHVQILFSGWPGDRGLGAYILALLLVLAASALVETLSSLSPRLSPSASAHGRRASAALLLTAVHAVRMGLAYLVMLAVMSFNLGVLVAAVTGHALGFLVFGSGGTRPRGQDSLHSAAKH